VTTITYRKKTWQEKLEDKKGLPKILELKENFPCYKALHKMGVEQGDKVVLVNPSEVVEVMKQVPKGKLITIIEVCKKIAENHKVKGCCSLTAGIFVTIAANAVEEAARDSKDLGIPYWRILKADGFLNPKYPGGEEAHKKHLEDEGHTFNIKGKRYRVNDFKTKLFLY
jgi:alkylated DNA nucleotide flippase Atl1